MAVWAIALSVLLVILGVIEGIALSYFKKEEYNWKGFAASVFDFQIRQWVVDIFLAFNLAEFALVYAEKHRLFDIQIATLPGFVGLFFAEEFCYYWFHRASHRVRWFWASHKPHHTPEELNLGHSFRFGWTSIATGSRFFYVPAVFLGFPSESVRLMLYLNLLYQFWIHNTWTPKLGWLEYVLNTPSHHRVHHATNLAYLDANYGGVLIIFDRLFGTFREERAGEPCRYGLVHPVPPNNPFVTSFHEWGRLLRDLWTARSVRDVAGYLFGPPGWTPDGRGETTQELRRRARAAAHRAQESSDEALVVAE